jgi:phage terminase large subunit-like protein
MGPRAKNAVATEAYYKSQKKTLRPGTYLRLHHNQWATAEETFITPEMWDPCVNQSHHPSITDRSPLFVGIDVGIKHDNAARVAVKWDEQGEKLILVSHRIWKPTPNKPLDLENTVEQDLRDLNEQGDVVEYLADPYQMHRSISILQAAGLPIREFPQTPANITLMGQTPFDLLTGQNLEIYSSDELRQQALSTVTVDNPRRWRITKEKASKKIDAIVALAMACVAARSTAEERAVSIGRFTFQPRGFIPTLARRVCRADPCRRSGNDACAAVRRWFSPCSGGPSPVKEWDGGKTVAQARMRALRFTITGFAGRL